MRWTEARLRESWRWRRCGRGHSSPRARPVAGRRKPVLGLMQ